jgi:hypothetical protein
MIGTGMQVFTYGIPRTYYLSFTELDDVSYECALRNVEINNFNGRIVIKRAQRDGVILFPLEDEAARYVNKCHIMCV